jgi:hypothetical protein
LELKLGKEEYSIGTKVRRRGTFDWNFVINVARRIELGENAIYVEGG